MGMQLDPINQNIPYHNPLDRMLFSAIKMALPEKII